MPIRSTACFSRFKRNSKQAVNGTHENHASHIGKVEDVAIFNLFLFIMVFIKAASPPPKCCLFLAPN